MNKYDEMLMLLEDIIPNPICELEYNKDYEFLIAIMLSAQTTDKRVNKVTKVLFNKYDSLDKLKDANLLDVENIVKELGNYHKKAKALIDIASILYNKYDGVVPKNRTLLEELPLVGRKTVSVFLSEYYNIPNIAVDTHVDRVSKRLGLSKDNDDVLKIEEKLKRKFKKDTWNDLHLRLVLFGRYYCTAKNPKCEGCKLKKYCKYNS